MPKQSGEANNSPTVLSVLPNRATLVLGAAVSAIFACVLWTHRHGSSGNLGYRAALAATALVCLVCLAQLIRPNPILEATAAGVRLGNRGLGRGFFFVPWAWVQQVLVLQTRRTHISGTGSLADCLALRMPEDYASRLPAVLWNAARMPAHGDTFDVAYSEDILGGDVHAIVDRLEALRRAASG